MAVTTYRTHNGRVRGESTGGVPATYLTDALGSVTATVDASATVVNTYRAKPYGQRLAKTGTGADPAYEWTGDTGSRRTGLAYAEQFNRRRHLGTRQASWTSVDPLWPDESAYGYVNGNPTTWLDYLGLGVVGCPDGMQSALDNACKTVRDLLDSDGNNPKFKKLDDCMKKKGHTNPDDLKNLLECMAANCGAPPAGSKFTPSTPCVICITSQDKSGLPPTCRSFAPNCSPGNPSVTLMPGNTVPPPPPSTPPNYWPIGPGYSNCGYFTQNGGDTTAPLSNCMKDLRKSLPQCGSVMVICSDLDPSSYMPNILHELGHTCGLTHFSPFSPERDYLNDLTCCMCVALGVGGDCKKVPECSLKYPKR